MTHFFLIRPQVQSLTSAILWIYFLAADRKDLFQSAGWLLVIKWIQYFIVLYQKSIDFIRNQCTSYFRFLYWNDDFITFTFTGRSFTNRCLQQAPDFDSVVACHQRNDSEWVQQQKKIFFSFGQAGKSNLFTFRYWFNWLCCHQHSWALGYLCRPPWYFKSHLPPCSDASLT